jgi:hypothetical protein
MLKLGKETRWRAADQFESSRSHVGARDTRVAFRASGYFRARCGALLFTELALAMLARSGFDVDDPDVISAARRKGLGVGWRRGHRRRHRR